MSSFFLPSLVGGQAGGGQPLDPRTIISAVLTGDTLEFTHLNLSLIHISEPTRPY